MDPDTEDKRHPESKIFICDILLQWINPLIQLANQRTLLASDVWDCPEHEAVSLQASKFWASWHAECDKAAEQATKPSLLRALFDAFGLRFIIAGCYQLTFMLLQIAQPFLVGELVSYVQTGEGGLRRGIGLALGFASVSFLSSIMLSRTFDYLRRLGVAIRSGVMMGIYEQALKLTTASRLQNSVGQTTNLMAIDSEKLNLSTHFIHFLWHGPMTCFIVMIILITEVGYAPALAGMGFLFVLVPLQNHIAGNIGITRRKMVKFTDERVKLTNELLQAIRVIKLYAWEEPIEQRVQQVRVQETSWLHRCLDQSGQLRELLFSAQPVAAVIIFSTANYASNKPLSLVQIFRLLAFLNITRFPLNLLAQALKAVNDGSVSLKRLETFFLLPTLQHANSREQVEKPSIACNNATFSWEDIDTPLRSSKKGIRKQEQQQYVAADVESNQLMDISSFCLRNLTFHSNRSNELVAVIGTVGSGKSSLISAILGEMNLLHGSSQVHGSLSYCAQTPWIQNLTLKQNVLFERSVDTISMEQEQEYQLATRAAALEADIAILSHGDMTEIGERGINLSGGQKARVSLARAFYSRYRSQIYLLDDPFSAVDGNTGNHIFHQGIVNMLGDKLRIIALNSHMHLLKHFDRILVLEDGKIVLDGSFVELFAQHEEVMSRITGLSSQAAAAAVEHREQLPRETPVEEEGKAADDTKAITTAEEVEEEVEVPRATAAQMPDRSTNCSIMVPSAVSSQSTSMSKSKSTLIKAEAVSSGIGAVMVYVKYFSSALMSLSSIFQAPIYSSRAVAGVDGNEEGGVYSLYGVLVIIVMIIIFSAAQLLRVAVDFYIAQLAEHWDDGQKHYYERFYYGSFGLLIASLTLRSMYLNFFAVRGCQVLHAKMLRKVLAAPVPFFFDTHTIGTILNRFAKDIETVDANVPETMLQMLINWFQVFSIFALCIWAAYWFAIVLIPMLYLFYTIYKYFSSVSRDLKRLEAVSRSPVYSSLSETLSGLETIRAYSDSQRFLSTHLTRMNANQKLLYHLWICMSWMTIRLELSTSLVLLSVSIICVCLRDSVSPIALGIALSYGLQLTALFQRCVQLVIEMDNFMTSTERVLEYMQLPQEQNTTTLPASSGKDKQEVLALDKSWPNKGSIVMEDVWMQYRDNPAVLRGLNVNISSGQRIGVCGRTGAGKSSVMMALFRIVEMSSGRILVDGKDISQVPLSTLRSALAIIPQDPVLFTGTIRFQLDPFELCSDEEVWKVLEQVHMAQMVRSSSQQLQELVKENGENLSQGQRQLLCIARALLRKAKILVVDEGTSAVDPHTDELIQQVLRQEVEEKGATVLAIAHRLQTIVDFDKIMVMSAGQLVEFGSPQELLSDPSSVFSSMIKESAH